MLTKGTPAQKLKFLFDVYDVDGRTSYFVNQYITFLLKTVTAFPTKILYLNQVDLPFFCDLIVIIFLFPGSGSIDREELKTVLRSCMEESSLSLSEEDLDDLTDALFDAADEDNSGSITFEELKAELEKHPGVIENLTIRLEIPSPNRLSCF